MAVHRSLLVVILLVAAPAAGVVGDALGNDAGSGGDAPDSPDEALGIAPGSYEGNLTADEDGPQDEDWYRVQVPGSTGDNGDPSGGGAVCTSANVTASDPARLHLRDPSDEDVRFDAEIGPAGKSLGLVRPASTSPLIGLSEVDPFSLTPYGLDVQVTRASEVPHQASETMPDQAEQAPSSCFGDTLDADDPHDAWTFEIDETKQVLISLGSESGREEILELRNPDLEVVETLNSTNGVDAVQLDLEETGQWSLDVSVAESVDTPSRSGYVVGFSMADPEEEEEEHHCRPHCMAFGG